MPFFPSTLNRTLPWGGQPAQDVQWFDFHPPAEDFRSEALAGLTQSPKFLSPKFLYDKTGSQLFEAICGLEEYYLTRTEMDILKTYAVEMGAIAQDGVLIEFGSGSSQKVRILLDAAPSIQTYIALDISKRHLYESCAELAAQYPNLQAIAICADYTQPLTLPDLPELVGKPRIGFFPGSSIGNLEPAEAIAFLKNVAQVLHPQGSLLIGVDLKKSREILEPAYKDAQGISGQFALNVLNRMNRELGANFDLMRFSYDAVYNVEAGRVEMYIVSLQAQTVTIGTQAIPFAAGERLRTEYSYKYTVAEFQAIAQSAGFSPQQVWTDDQQWFSIHQLQVE
jgi:dimethylhistidine N-methyltransferase